MSGDRDDYDIQALDEFSEVYGNQRAKAKSPTDGRDQTSPARAETRCMRVSVHDMYTLPLARLPFCVRRALATISLSAQCFALCALDDRFSCAELLPLFIA